MKQQASTAAALYADAPPPQQQQQQKNHFFNRATAFVLADSHQDYVTHSTLRNILRALIVLGVFGATVAFIAVKYATDNSLRSATVTVREDNYKDLNQDQIEVAICPCRNETFFWSTFASYKEPLNKNYTMQVELCQQSIVPQLANTTQPGPGAPVEEVQAYIGYLNTLQSNTATLLSCSLALQGILAALDPDPSAHLIGVGDNWYSTELLSEQQVKARLNAFMGQKTLDFNQGFGGQLALQRLVLGNLQTNLSTLNDSVSSGNDTVLAQAVEAATLSFDLYANTTNEALTVLLDTSSDTNGYVKRLTDTLKGAVSINYDDYAAACAPQYCDYTQKKSAWSRLTEFLGLLGGLYTTFLGIGLTSWFLVDLLLPQGHGRVMI